VDQIPWPWGWQPDACAAVAPYVDSESELVIWVTSNWLSWSRAAGCVYAREDGLYLRKPDSLPDGHDGSRLAGGTVMAVALQRAARRMLYEHEYWASDPKP
jgi:hypothetical protein